MDLNLGVEDGAAFAQARAWYDRLWNAAEPYDLAALFEEPEATFPPWLIFLRILFQLYGAELDAEERTEAEITLTDFQKDGLARAKRILREHGGVIVADEVGLGKTFIAGELLLAATRPPARARALLICPAALRDTTWDKFRHAHDIGPRVEMLSYEELATDVQFHHATRRPRATRQALRHPLDDYALVVVDEAHNYRNPAAPYRAEVLRRLLAGPRKQLVLLTATPVNNALWDLYHLMMFFLRQEGALVQKGIPSIRQRFREAEALDPSDLSPDLLYPLIDAVTVKRTRGFVKTHYAHDTVVDARGRRVPVQFPKAVALRIDYTLDHAAPGLFDAAAAALDPDGSGNALTFARYAPDRFLHTADEDDRAMHAPGLLRSGLLKRFESSAEAFRLSLRRMLREHDRFLDALVQGKVITAAFLRELAGDEALFEDMLDLGEHTRPATQYDAPALQAAVEHDRATLRDLIQRLDAAQEAGDPKLDAVVQELARIAAEARGDAATAQEERRNRKVLLFSYYGDTIAYLRRRLERRIAEDARLACYRGRLVAVAGDGLDGEEASRNDAVWGFAPETSDPPPGRGTDRFDLLLATDVLAEGLNLQQCRHIINYDLPWNPMRLVQRHGRIDRIGSPHKRVFMRTVFPADRLDALLDLEQRILRKLAKAARSIGVATSPVQGAEAEGHVFAETRAEIEKLAQGDAGIFDPAGTAAAMQSGEEYRQRLRIALSAGRDAITGLPGGAGSGLRAGRQTGVLFCAEVLLADGPRSFLRFVPAGTSGRIERGLGPCLRMVDCTSETPREMPPGMEDRVFEHWDRAKADILWRASVQIPGRMGRRSRPTRSAWTLSGIFVAI
ncbi:hypothetical protein J4558_11100 [Leptolyngbya sp. 15MV]|nr:hypothetical protein J4558_11100 [Leptolyngbya sp. 15MV]